MGHAEGTSSRWPWQARRYWHRTEPLTCGFDMPTASAAPVGPQPAFPSVLLKGVFVRRGSDHCRSPLQQPGLRRRMAASEWHVVGQAPDASRRANGCTARTSRWSKGRERGGVVVGGEMFTVAARSRSSTPAGGLPCPSAAETLGKRLDRLSGADPRRRPRSETWALVLGPVVGHRGPSGLPPWESRGGQGYGAARTVTAGAIRTGSDRPACVHLAGGGLINVDRTSHRPRAGLPPAHEGIRLTEEREEKREERAIQEQEDRPRPQLHEQE